MKGERLGPAGTGPHEQELSAESDKSSGAAVTESNNRDSGRSRPPSAAPPEQLAAAFRAETGAETRVLSETEIAVGAEGFPLGSFEDARKVLEAGWEPAGYELIDGWYARRYVVRTEGSDE